MTIWTQARRKYAYLNTCGLVEARPLTRDEAADLIEGKEEPDHSGVWLSVLSFIAVIGVTWYSGFVAGQVTIEQPRVTHEIQESREITQVEPETSWPFAYIEGYSPKRGD